MPDRRKPSDESLKAAVLEKALGHAAADGFSEAMLVRAGKDAGAGAEMLLHLFSEGPASLVDFYSAHCDAEMERRLTATNLPSLKVRKRIAEAVLTRLAVLKPHKETARRAAAFLTLPMNAVLGARLVYRTVDAMWRAAGDTSTDFNFYTKRGILAGVYTATLMRWFTDAGEDEFETRAFLDSRIENVMQFERLKAGFRERMEQWPSVSDVLARFTAHRS